MKQFMFARASQAFVVTLGFVGSVEANDKVYWTDVDSNKIQSADLSGANVRDRVATGPVVARGIAVDPVGGKLYWTERDTKKIRRADIVYFAAENFTTTQYAALGVAIDPVGGKIYWASSDGIRRANLDGTGGEYLYQSGGPEYIALDVNGGKMYWSDSGFNGIRRANLDGSNPQSLVTGIGVFGLALDVGAGKMYWTDSLGGDIQRANLDGSNVETLIPSVFGNPLGIALDVENGFMYWANGPRIQRARLDGSNVQDVITGLLHPYGIAIGPGCTGLGPDVDNDDWCFSLDCDDGDPSRNPGVVEVCGDGIDNDCDGYTDEAPGCCTDPDGDGDGLSPCQGDCNDADPGVRTSPGAIGGLAIAKNVPTVGSLQLSWSNLDATAGTSTSYDVVRGVLSTLRASGFPGGAVCVSDDLVDSPYSEAVADCPAAACWYLIRGQNSCGTGSYGSTGLNASGPCP